MDIIRIKNLEVYAHHGVLKEENILGQKFLISVDMECNTRKAGNMDDLEQTIDYAGVCRQIVQCMTEHTYQLVEAVAEQLAEEILLGHYPLVRRVIVEVTKPWAPIQLPLESVAVRIERSWHTAYIGLGSNMGDKRGHLERALELLKKDEMTKLRKQSSFYETAPVGMTEQDDFLNAVAEIETLDTPQELLALVAGIEKEGKRERTVHWGPRTIDLDILLYDGEVVAEENLYIPHREMTKREFVLKPLNEIAPYAYHPISGKYVCELYAECEKAASGKKGRAVSQGHETDKTEV